METKKLLAFAQEAEGACLSTIDADGFPEVRAMLNLKNVSVAPHLEKTLKKDIFDTYFTTNLSSRKILQMGKAGVYYVKPETFEGLLLLGTLENIKDKKILKAFWHPSWEMYYKGGFDGGDYALLKFNAETFQHYSQFKVLNGNCKIQQP